MTRLTIGLPVYNGGPSLARSLDRLREQTFQDFTLIINDNASTDDTADIAARYCALDKRIRYRRNAENVSWYDNFRIVLLQADSPYFMWATHDDLWEPRFAEANIELLDRHPEAVCSVSRIIYFSDDGTEQLAPDTGPLIGPPRRRLHRFLMDIYSCGRLYGVYRTEVLRACFPEKLHIPSADWLAVALTLLQGDHLEVPDVLLRREAQKPGYYVRRFGVIDRFEPNWKDWLIPLRRFNAELKQRTSPDVWKAIWPALVYLNVQQSLIVQSTFVPILKPPLRAARFLIDKFILRRRDPDPCRS
jgi:glycosyltransferase involved in cell wall biosynthesis